MVVILTDVSPVLKRNTVLGNNITNKTFGEPTESAFSVNGLVLKSVI